LKNHKYSCKAWYFHDDKDSSYGIHFTLKMEAPVSYHITTWHHNLEHCNKAIQFKFKYMVSQPKGHCPEFSLKFCNMKKKVSFYWHLSNKHIQTWREHSSVSKPDISFLTSEGLISIALSISLCSTDACTECYLISCHLQISNCICVIQFITKYVLFLLTKYTFVVNWFYIT